MLLFGKELTCSWLRLHLDPSSARLNIFILLFISLSLTHFPPILEWTEANFGWLGDNVVCWYDIVTFCLIVGHLLPASPNYWRLMASSAHFKLIVSTDVLDCLSTTPWMCVCCGRQLTSPYPVLATPRSVAGRRRRSSSQPQNYFWFSERKSLISYTALCI